MKHQIGIIAFGVLATALAAALPARAETIFLTCTPNNGVPAFNVTVDLTNKTANNLPATINATAIDWLYQGGSASPETITSITTHHHIDRTAGTYTEYTIFHLTSGQDSAGGSNTYPCTAGSAPATKF